MNFPTAVKTGFQKYWQCSDRASRSEYWYWTLFATIMPIPFMLVDMAMMDVEIMGPLELVVTLATFLPSFFVMIRRLHDVDRSGHWWMISFTIIGIIPLLWWMIKKGTPGENRFGPDPLAKPLNSLVN